MKTLPPPRRGAELPPADAEALRGAGFGHRRPAGCLFDRSAGPKLPQFLNSIYGVLQSCAFFGFCSVIMRIVQTRRWGSVSVLYRCS